MKRISLYIFSVLALAACQTSGEKPASDFAKELQLQLIEAEEGQTIAIPEGTFEFTRSLSLDGIANVTIKGAGMDKTILSFKNQTEGAEGLRITADGIILQDFSVHDSKGDAIKVQDSDGVIFRNIGAGWNGGSKETNGAYGLYPVSCKNVLIENCEVFAASDAGIYVGQTQNAVIRGNHVHENVAGIEVENCIFTDVYQNHCVNNTGGIFIFDLPDLPQKNGRHIRVFDNEVTNNNHPNFSPAGNTVALVPAGTGMFMMATRDVDVFNNTITGHTTVGAAIISYMLTGKPFDDPEYNPFSSGISLRNNTFARGIGIPDTTRELGGLLAQLFQDKSPDVIYDGFVDPASMQDGRPVDEKMICIRENGPISFANINAPTQFQDVKVDLAEYDCSLNELSEVTLQL